MSKSQKWILLKSRLFQAVHSPRVISGYLFGFWIGVSMGIRYGAFAYGQEIGFSEAFLLVANDKFSLSLLLIGYLIIIADAPFIDTETYYVLIRSGGRSWRIAMIAYLACQLMIYEGLVFLGCFLPGILQGNLTTGWSSTLEILLNVAPKIAITEYQLPVLDSGFIDSWTTFSALIHSFLLTFSYMFFLGFVVFAGNLNQHFPVGNCIAIGIHFIGLLLLSDFVPLYQPSLLAHGILQFHIPERGALSLSQSLLLFLICDLGTGGYLKFISQRMDYNTAVSQRNW